METHTYPHFPSEVSTVHLALYSNVTNAAELKRRLVAAATQPGEEGDREREAVNYAFVDAKLVGARLFSNPPCSQFSCRLPVACMCRRPFTRPFWLTSNAHYAPKLFTLKCCGL
jgi:hypothetical protein